MAAEPAQCVWVADYGYWGMTFPDNDQGASGCAFAYWGGGTSGETRRSIWMAT
jgi:hypothetical protein